MNRFRALFCRLLCGGDFFYCFLWHIPFHEDLRVFDYRSKTDALKVQQMLTMLVANAQSPMALCLFGLKSALGILLLEIYIF